ncbi:prepilin-type N-terminal cleavage/methylation domain-containing protein [Cyanobium sp. Candia 9D4]|uniref:type IV pilus modification PilV family protein n=1 Tax=Cyanobium sp. Candia 9D4 TaxID=2823707 RepID=UPI0020CBF635|nr:prepilin-type N-terminal cleavage/methylation domain-containing protein [Cyanobium sp. Candia 9D4]MCP9935017.1 prepilin-type N-terminal cleavage/methylation domain-containing protein [Cyanobium sp. Candia 9D4]
MNPSLATVSPAPRRCHGAAGFSLVELMVSSVLLVLALTGTSVLFVESNRSSAAAETRYRQQALVDTDLARVRRLNDRYTCSTGSCTSLGSVELGKHDFFPPPVSTAANGNSSAGQLFEALCNSTGLITQLVADIGAPPAALTGAGITYSIDTANQGQQTVSEFGTNVVRNLHRYTITYTNGTSGELLRRVTLVPTTVAWCP